MRYILLQLLMATTAFALRPEQVLMEEGSRTNRSAAAWLADSMPVVSDVATYDYMRALVTTSMYATGISTAPGALSLSTERFSTNWSYSFRSPGGMSIVDLEVRNRLSVLPTTFLAQDLTSRFLMVTNRGDYGVIAASNVTLRGSSYSAEDIVSSVAVATPVSVGTLALDEFVPSGGVLRVAAPAVHFSREPVFMQASDIYAGTNYASTASFDSLGEFNLGKYSAGLMWLTTTNMGLRQMNDLQSVGMANVGGNVTYDVGRGVRAPAGWACVPVVVTQYDLSNPGFSEGYWEYSPSNAVVSYGVMTSAVGMAFSSLGTGVVQSVAGYTNAASLVANSPSPSAANQVDYWYRTLTATTGVDTVSLAYAVSNYVVATYSMFSQLRGEGSVCVVDERASSYAKYTRYRQTMPAEGGLYRVTMQLHLTGSASFSATPSRYWLLMNNGRRLVHTVSSAGEIGAAFTFIDTSREPPGYLYLDLSEVANRNSGVLNSIWYYVKVELLRGFNTWPQ